MITLNTDITTIGKHRKDNFLLSAGDRKKLRQTTYVAKSFIINASWVINVNMYCYSARVHRGLQFQSVHFVFHICGFLLFDIFFCFTEQNCCAVNSTLSIRKINKTCRTIHELTMKESSSKNRKICCQNLLNYFCCKIVF